jgi:hypothetical protein
MSARATHPPLRASRARRPAIGRARAAPGVAPFAFAIALGLALPAAAFAQSKTGTTMGQFLLIEPSARVAGMGNAGSALDGGLDAAYFNAAAAGRIDRGGVVFSHAAWLADVTYDYVAAGLPLGKWGNSFLSVTSLASGDMDVRTVEHPLGTGERFSVNDVAIGVGYGLEVTDRFAVGGQVTFMQETIWHSSAGTTTFNVGTLYRASEEGLHIGASLSNFGTSSQYDGRDIRVTYDQNTSVNGDNGSLPGLAFTESFATPVLFRVGLGMPFRPSRDLGVLVAVDAYHPSDETESVSAGAELELRRMLSLRAGWQNLFLQDAEVGLTLGLGLRGDFSDTFGYRVDYAWADHGRLDSTQRLSFALAFGEH